MFQWSIPSKLADSFRNIMKFKNSYLEEMALHRDMRNGISHKIATILSKFSFLDMSNTFRQFHFFIIVSPFKKAAMLHSVLFLRRSQHVNWQVASWLFLSWSADERQTSGEPTQLSWVAVALSRRRKDSIFSPNAARWWAALNYKGRRFERRY